MSGQAIRTIRRGRLLAAILMTALALPVFGGAQAADPPAATAAAAGSSGAVPDIKPGDPIVATVDGQQIKRSEVFQFIAQLPDQVKQMPIEQLFPLAEEQVIDNKLVAKKADAASLAGDPEVKKLEAQSDENIIRSVYLERQVASQISNAKLADAYKDLLTKSANVQEVHARHIMVDSKEKAEEVIKKLNGGAKWEDVAKEYASGPSAKNGGDLGYFAKDEMLPEVANAAFSLDVGKYTKDPVKTQLGWHVIQVLDKRKRPEPDFDTVKPQLEAMLRQQALKTMVDQWQKDASIKRYDINGQPVKNEPPTLGK